MPNEITHATLLLEVGEDGVAHWFRSSRPESGAAGARSKLGNAVPAAVRKAKVRRKTYT